jgi:hypothetical protein
MSSSLELQDRPRIEETEVALPARQEEPKPMDHHHVEGLPLFLVMIGLVLCLFLPALDQLILSKSLPFISPFLS